MNEINSIPSTPIQRHWSWLWIEFDWMKLGQRANSLWVGYRLRSSRQPAKREDQLLPSLYLYQLILLFFNNYLSFRKWNPTKEGKQIYLIFEVWAEKLNELLAAFLCGWNWSQWAQRATPSNSWIDEINSWLGFIESIPLHFIEFILRRRSHAYFLSWFWCGAQPTTNQEKKEAKTTAQQ